MKGRMMAQSKKSKDIIIFAASELFSKTAADVVKKRNLENHIEIVDATGESTIRLGERLVREGSRIFIARGRNTQLLQQHITVPVIDVPFLYEEILRSVHKTGCPPEHIAIIGFDKAYDTMVKFRRLSGQNVQLIGPHSPDTAEKEVLAAIRPDTQVLIGGFSVSRVAKEKGLRQFPLAADPDNISLAIDSALNILASMERQDAYVKTISATVDRIPNAVVSCDLEGRLLFSNEQANALFSTFGEERLLKQLLYFDQGGYIRTLSERISSESEASLSREQVICLSERSYIAEYLPVVVNCRVKHVVIILSSANSIQSAEKRLRLSQAKRGYAAKHSFSDIIGSSRCLQDTIGLARQYARSNSTVLITGETGTGKEIFAQSIHNASSRAAEPFVAINCAALPKSLLESELFGYVKGAFTGANQEGKMGIFELAHKGTVFLDEIGEMDLEVQAKLLRVLQEREVSRLGDDKIIPVDIRIISATNQNLYALVKEKRFREDLLYRLNVLELSLPPLRSRREDIPELTAAYLGRRNFSLYFDAKAMERLCAFSYPGNVRQLHNLLERISVLAGESKISSAQLAQILPAEENHDLSPEPAGHMQDSNGFLPEDVNLPNNPAAAAEDYEKLLIQKLLLKHRNNRAKTAGELGISTVTLWRKMKKFGLL